MRLPTILVIFFYTVIFIAIGITLIVLPWGLIQPEDINRFLAYLQANLNYRIIVSAIGMILALISYSFAQMVLGRFQRERNIAFNTSSGEVTISLSAVEDLIKRLSSVIPEIKELRPDVIATKKGIVVDLRVVLRSETNIPEMTGRLQEMARSKIQEVLGIEEQIIIRIHVAKIIAPEEKDKKKKEPARQEPAIPFGGYGRT